MTFNPEVRAQQSELSIKAACFIFLNGHVSRHSRSKHFYVGPSRSQCPLHGPRRRWDIREKGPLALCGARAADSYQRGEAVFQNLHGQLHLASDHVSVEVHVQRQVEVFGDTPVERGEGTRVSHLIASADRRQVSATPAN